MRKEGPFPFPFIFFLIHATFSVIFAHVLCVLPFLLAAFQNLATTSYHHHQHYLLSLLSFSSPSPRHYSCRHCRCSCCQLMFFIIVFLLPGGCCQFLVAVDVWAAVPATSGLFLTASPLSQHTPPCHHQLCTPSPCCCVCEEQRFLLLLSSSSWSGIFQLVRSVFVLC